MPESFHLDQEEIASTLELLRQRQESGFEMVEEATATPELLDKLTCHGIVLLDAVGKILAWNEGAIRILGLPREELIGKNLSTIFSPGDIVTDLPKRLLESSHESGTARHDCWVMRSDGDRARIELVVHAQESESEDSASYCLIFQDITERHEQLTGLLDREARLRSAFDHAAIGMALVSLEGKWISVNRAMCGIVGYSPQDLLSDKAARLTHPEDAGLDDAQQQRAIAGEISAYQVEKRYIHSHGHVVWVLRTVSLVRNSNGEPAYFISQVQDITDRKHSLRALRDSEERYRLLSDYATDMISRHSSDGTFEYVSPSSSRILGFIPNELVGRSIYDFVHSEDIASLQSAHRGLLLEGDIWVVCYRIQNSKGDYVWFETNCVGVRDKDSNEVRHIIASSRDITQRKQLEQMIEDQMVTMNETSMLLEIQKAALEEANNRLELMATTDSLTAVGNRRAFQDRLDLEAAAAREYGALLSMLLIDVDHFKSYNDTFGHQAGDEALRVVGSILKKLQSKKSFVARYGGEEFVVLLRETDETNAKQFAETVRKSIAEHEWPARSVTVSIGVSSFDPDKMKPADLVEVADQALYFSKQHGRNRVTHAHDLEIQIHPYVESTKKSRKRSSAP